MDSSEFRIERDSLGELKVPREALYGAQTQRAIENFPISGQVMPRAFIRALGLTKAACAIANRELGGLSIEDASAIEKASLDVARGDYDAHFPVDVFQTGSGTSTNMNANEVIARLASIERGKDLHPNDDVNRSQSSNDVIPTCIHISAALEVAEKLLPALKHLAITIETKSCDLSDTVKTGRTHLMDAMPVTMCQELRAWATQIRYSTERLDSCQNRLCELAIGGTAVGTGINAPEGFGAKVANILAEMTGIQFVPKKNYFEALSCQDTAVELSGHLKTLAVSLMKISNDLRWMNSGPLTGLGEIILPTLQPGSSIMPGKVNPVIPESVAMVCAQVMGNDTTITVAGQSGNFQLNVMLPVIAANLTQSLELLANSCTALADKAIKGFEVNDEHLTSALERNPVLVTALNEKIGYAKGAEIAKQAYAEKRPVMEVALEQSGLSESELKKLLDPKNLI